MTWLRRRLAGADNFNAWSKWARDCSQDGILFGRCCHQWQRLWLCRDCLFNLYCLNSFFASKMAEEGLMLAIRRDFFIPNLRFDWANTQMAAEHRLWEEQLEQKRLQCLLAFLWRFTSQMRDSNTFKTPMHAHAHPQLKWLDSTGSGCLEATKDIKFWLQRPAESAAISAKKSLQHGLWQGAERCRKLAESVARHVLKRVPSDSELFNRFVAIAFVSPLRCLCYGSCWPWSSFGALSVLCDWASAPV